MSRYLTSGDDREKMIGKRSRVDGLGRFSIVDGTVLVQTKWASLGRSEVFVTRNPTASGLDWERGQREDFVRTGRQK